MAKHAAGRKDMLADLAWRLRTLPRRLRGEEPGASKAEALEDLLLVGTFGLGVLIVLVFTFSTLNTAPGDSYATAARTPQHTASADRGYSGPKDLKPVKSLSRGGGATGATSSGGGAGGGGGGSASGGGNACDPSLSEEVRNRAGFRMFSFWRDRDQQLPACDTVPRTSTNTATVRPR